eukprot:4287788-Pleurochrysis_carterae.AAC.1
MARMPPLLRYSTNGEVGSSSRSVATTAAVCRLRRRTRSAIVPSPSVSLFVSMGAVVLCRPAVARVR